MRTVAFCGFGEVSLGPVYELPDEVEIWALNDAPHRYNHRIDVLFEMHDLEKIYDPHGYGPNYEAQLIYLRTAEHPVYMLENFDEFPSSIEYPLDEALELVDGCGRFAFTFCYMAALAILQGVDRVEVYGFEMDNYDTEYIWQKPIGLYWIGKMEGAGIDVYIPPESSLFPEFKLYGYERFHMVSRQSIEHEIKRYKKQKETNIEKLRRWQGIMAERQRTGKGDLPQAIEKCHTYEMTAAMADGAVQSLQHLLDECDLSEDWKA